MFFDLNSSGIAPLHGDADSGLYEDSEELPVVLEDPDGTEIVDTPRACLSCD